MIQRRALTKPTRACAAAGFTILDHARTDNVEGIASIVGGKLAIFRLMAEKISDLVCERLGVDAPCRTADTQLR